MFLVKAKLKSPIKIGKPKKVLKDQTICIKIWMMDPS